MTSSLPKRPVQHVIRDRAVTQAKQHLPNDSGRIFRPGAAGRLAPAGGRDCGSCPSTRALPFPWWLPGHSVVYVVNSPGGSSWSVPTGALGGAGGSWCWFASIAVWIIGGSSLLAPMSQPRGRGFTREPKWPPISAGRGGRVSGNSQRQFAGRDRADLGSGRVASPQGIARSGRMDGFWFWHGVLYTATGQRSRAVRPGSFLPSSRNFSEDPPPARDVVMRSATAVRCTAVESDRP